MAREVHLPSSPFPLLDLESRTSELVLKEIIKALHSTTFFFFQKKPKPKERKQIVQGDSKCVRDRLKPEPRPCDQKSGISSILGRGSWGLSALCMEALLSGITMAAP
jgi:hypothetical protein